MNSTDDWQSTTLGALASGEGCFIQTGPFGSQLHKRDYQKTGVGTVNPTHLQSSRINHTHVPRVSRETGDRLERHRLVPGDILFARRGEIGRHGLVTEAEDGWLCGTGCFLVRIQRVDIENQFLSFLISTPETVDWLNRHAAGVVMPNLTNTVLHQLPLTVPPVVEQRKIAAVLSLVQKALGQQERLIRLTAELKVSLLRKLFAEGLNGEAQKETEIGLVPRGWEVVRLSEVCAIESGGTPSKERGEFWNGAIPWVSPKDMKRPRLEEVTDHISQEGLYAGSRLAPAGSVFVVVRGMILAKDIPVALAEVPMAFNQDMKAIIPGARIVSSFLLYAITAFKQKLFEKVGRSAHGTMTLMSSELERFLIPLPDKASQQEIAIFIETIEKKHRLHLEKRAVLANLFRTLLHKLMSAKIRVNDLDLREVEKLTA